MVLATDPDTRTIGIRHQAEHVLGSGSRFVGPRHGLQRDGAHAENEIVAAAGHLARNGVGRGDVVFRAKAGQLYAASIGIAARGQCFDRAVGAIFKHPRGRVPHQRHPDRTSRILRRFARSAVGVEKDRGRQENQNESEGESLESFEHGGGRSPPFRGAEMFCRHKSRRAAPRRPFGRGSGVRQHRVRGIVPWEIFGLSAYSLAGLAPVARCCADSCYNFVALKSGKTRLRGKTWIETPARFTEEYPLMDSLPGKSQKQ